MRIALCVALMAATARAQDTAAIRACDQPATGSVAAAFYGQLSTIPATDTERVGSAYMSDLLEAIRESLHTTPMALPVYMVGPDGAVLMAEGTLIFKVTRQGHVRDLGLGASSLSAPFDRMIYHAVATADSQSLIPSLPHGAPSPAEFYLTVYAAPYPARPDWASWLKRAGVVQPLLRTTLPQWTGQVTLAAPSSKGEPYYPEIARRANVEDTLLVRYVVDENGRIVPRSVFFMAGTYRDFANSVQSWLPKARFTPARIGTCAVKSIQWQVFNYKLLR